MASRLIMFSALAALACTAPAHAQVTVSAGLEYLTGDYGKSESTQEWRIPLSARYRSGLWSFRVSVPLSRVAGVSSALEREARADSDGEFIDPDDDDANGTPGGSSGLGAGAQSDRRQSGFGDATISASYALLDSAAAAFGLDLGGSIKVPVASGSKCYLTNGETDLSIQASAYQSFGRLEPYFLLGWTKRGDPPPRDADCQQVAGADINLRNPFHAGFGVRMRLSEDSALSVDYEFREKLRSSSDPKSEARVTFQQRLTEVWRLNFYTLVGLSDSSPDWGVGTGIAYRF
jgi:hypothetical protein